MESELKELQTELAAVSSQELKARTMYRRYPKLTRYYRAWAKVTNRKHELERQIHELKQSNPYL